MKSRILKTSAAAVFMALVITGSIAADEPAKNASADSFPAEIMVSSAFGVVSKVERLEWPNAAVTISKIVYDKASDEKPLVITLLAFGPEEKLDFTTPGVRSKMSAYYLQPGDMVRFGIYRLSESSGWQLKLIERVTSMGGKQEVRVSLGVRPNPVKSTSKVNLRLTVTNSTSEPQTFIMPSGQRFDFQVLKDGKEVWRWSDGKMFTMAVSQLRLKPGETRSFSADWNIVDNNGAKLAPGAYQISGWLATAEDGKSFKSPAVQLTVN